MQQYKGADKSPPEGQAYCQVKRSNRNCLVDFVVPARYKVRIKENEKINEYLDLSILPWLLLSLLAFVPDGVSINGRFEAERPPTSAGPPSGGRAAFFFF